MKDLKFAAGFIFLNLYLRLVPSLFDGNEVLWLFTFISFFPLTYLIAKWSSNTGFHELGFAKKQNWKKALLLGVLVGSIVWTLLTATELAIGSLQFIEWQAPRAASWIAIQALVVAVLGSATNDLLTRGYVYAHWKGRLSTAAILWLSTFLYIADDIWLEGWDIRNNIFSLILGLAFGLSLVRTKSLWMNTGMHAGLNVIYYLVYGFGNDKIHFGIFTSSSQQHLLSPYLGIIAAVVVLVLTILLTQNMGVKETSLNSASYQRRLVDHTETFEHTKVKA